MARVRIRNTFEKGISADVDMHRQPDGRYRYGRNVRVMFNTQRVTNSLTLADDLLRGNTTAIASMRGNKAIGELTTGYTVIDSVDMEDYVVLFSHDGTNSEIGISTVNGTTEAATYTVVFNDGGDPNGELLGFPDVDYIQSIGIIENSLVQRVHFVDGMHVPRCINIALYNDNSSPYTWWKSVHGMAYRADVSWGRLKYLTTAEGGGSLKSGMYQISYRYITRDGQESVWFPLSPHYFITTQKMYPDGSTLITNHHDYYMDASEMQTTHYMDFKLYGVDTRFWKVEFAYAYWTTDTAPKETRIFQSSVIDPDISDLPVTLFNHGGIPIAFDEFQTTYKNIRSAKGVGMNDNVLWYGGIEYEDSEKTIDTSQITLATFTREMNSDELFNEDFSTGDPLTNSTPASSDISLVAYTDDTSTDVLNTYTDLGTEYRNYKGNLWQSLFKGYWRGETYPFAIVLFDNLGQPCFAQHIKDFTFPEQYDAPTTDGNITGMKLLLMGLKISGITLPDTVLYRDGKLIVSGFSIVRADRIKGILHQGVVTPCIQTADETDAYILGYPENKFVNPDKEDADFEGLWDRNDHSTPEHHRSSCIYSSPDVCVEEKIIAAQESHYLKIVNGVRSRYYGLAGYDEARGIHCVPTPDLQHVYDKYYLCDTSDGGDDMASVGDKSRIRISTCITNQYEKGKDKFIADLDPEDLDLDFFPASEGRWKDATAGEVYDGHIKRSRVHYNAVWMRTKDIKRWDAGYGAADGTYGNTNSEGKWRRHFIANYTIPKTEYYTQGTGVSTRIYYPTGHFQPINQSVIDTLPTSTVSGIDYYTFNNVEVWGGDCFLDYWDFLRNYPIYDNCDQEGNNSYRDCSIGMIVPIESNYNMAMRLGRKFANVCVYPEAAACGTGLPVHKKGINLNQPEDWNVNTCLQAKWIYPTFSEKSKDITVNYSAPFSLAYSLRKVYGEKSDSHRKLLPNNGGDLEGIQGDFTAFAYANNYMYFFQQRGFGFILARERTAVSGSDGVPIYLGTGADFGGAQYISRIHGTQHPKSVVCFRNQIFAVDARSNTFLRFSQAGLDEISDNEGLHDLAVLTLPLWGNGSYAKEAGAIQGGIDQENYEVLFSYDSGSYEVPSGFDASVCLRFNVLLGAFISDDNCYPKRWIKYGKYLLTESENSLYLHNRGKIGRFYGVYHQSKIRFVVTAGVVNELVFDNMQINCNADAKLRILSAVLKTENTNTKTLNILTDPRAKYRIDNLRFPLREDTAGVDRAAGQYLDCEITIDNDIQDDDEDDIQVIITSIETDATPRTNRQ
jgi:hypothetical protein